LGQYEKETRTSQSHLIFMEAENTHAWTDWIVAKSRELDLCEKERV
jgi:hypothetical protein